IPNEYGNVDIDEFIIMPNHLHGIIIYKRAFANKRAPARGAPTDHGRGGITALQSLLIIRIMMKSFFMIRAKSDDNQ
ncbi:MAG: hypothetical protein ABFR82_02580, partial [Nitrospirota bacterium]